MKRPAFLSGSTAFRFVLVLGIANFFADMTYEGARSVTGPFLGTLGASAAVVGFTAGLGELLGYTLRSISGFISDKTGKYWIVTIVGYIVNMLAVPALALSGNWPLAAGLIVTERTGRAIRKPSTEAMLSFAGKQIGRGWVFGLNEALDQAGATVGPLVMSFALFEHRGYRTAFSYLLLPAVLTIAIILVARYFFPRPHELEVSEKIQSEHFPRAYWLYMIPAVFFAAGFADFALIAYHFQKSAIIAADVVPIYYAVAMAMGAIGGLLLGKLFDRFGLRMLLIGFFLSALAAPFLFLGSAWVALVGMVLSGIGIGAQGSLLNAIVSELVLPDKRSTAFGVFDTAFGISWFGGSWLMGVLYDRSILAVVLISAGLQLLSVLIVVLIGKQR